MLLVLSLNILLAPAWLTIAPVMFDMSPANSIPPMLLPADFQDTAVFSGLTLPTAVRIAPNGKIFVAEKSGIIKVYDNISDTTPTIFADLRSEVQNFDDRGLLALAIHPNFPTQPYVYAFYAMDAPIGQTPPVYNDACPSENTCITGSRLSKLTVTGDMMTAKQVLIEGWCHESSHHSSADIAFGNDGALYVSHGDGGTADFADYGQQSNACGDPPNEGGAMHAQDLQTPADPVTFAGSIIRVDPDTGAAMPDNPLIGGNPDDDRIIAYGLRNPFRISIDRQSTNIWIGNPGWNNWEEVERIANPVDSQVENFGWPCYEGVGRQPAYDAANLPVCEALYTAGTSVPPYHQYTTTGGQAISGVALYRGTNFPAAYNGALFFADYTQGFIKVMMPGGNGLPNPANIVDFVPSGAAVVDLQVGPGGELFYADIVRGQIRMIKYTSQNVPPVADARADKTNGPTPLTVNFDGSFSTDGDPGDTLNYAWDLDGDGQFDDSTAVSPQWTYNTAGNFTVSLRVTDPIGQSGVDTLLISAGNSAPQVSILSPTPSTLWHVGETIQFSGQAVDPDSGPMPASAYRWNVILHHCAVENPTNCHTHPQQEIVGVSSGSFLAPDHEYPAFLELRLTATEPTFPNLSSTTSIQIQPRTTTLNFDTVPSGLQVTVYSATNTTPFSRQVIVNAQTSISAVTPQTSGGQAYQFVSWSDGGAQTHLVTATEAPQTFVATYGQIQAPSVWNSWDVVTQAGAPQAIVTSSTTGIPAEIDFYESTNNFGVARGAAFNIFQAAPHIDAFNKLDRFWSVGVDDHAYPYAGKSTVNRGSDAGESNTPSPLGVKDLQLHPPNNDHTTVAAFKVPQSGTYTISNLGVRRPDAQGDPVRYRVFNAQGTQLALLTATNSRAWATSATMFTLNNLTAGQYIYFAVDRSGDVFWDAAEVSWTITANLGGPPPPPPTCSLSVNPGSIPQGNSSTLSWTSQNANTLVIDQGIGSVTPVGSGSVSVSPAATTTYTGTATGSGGTVNCGTTLTVTPPPDTTPPVVTINSPGDGQTVSGTISISATATDNQGVTSMEILVDGNVVTNCATFTPCTFNWNTTTVSNGQHTIMARARDAVPNVGSDSHTINVNNVPPPSCALNINPASIPQGSSSTLSWTSQNANTFVIDQGIGSVTPVGSGAVNVSPAVTTTYTGTATGSGGTVNCSTTLTVTPPPDTTPPVVTISSPGDGQTVSGTISISATATDNQGVTSMEILVDGNVVTNCASFAPCTFNWNTTTVSNGQHTIMARARDAVPNVGSDAHTINVNNVPPPSCALNINPASINEGSSTTLSWSSANAVSLSIDQGIGPVTPVAAGSMQITPATSRTYTGTAVNSNGQSSVCGASVTVIPATPTQSVWNSWDVAPQDGLPQAVVRSAPTGISTDVEFYESTNDFGVMRSSLFAFYQSELHPDTFNELDSFWSSGFGDRAYPYAGKSTVGRGSGAGETNAPAPLSVRDLQLHPPDNDHTTVAAFRVPQAGTYTVSNLGVRRVDAQGGAVSFRVFNAQAAQLAVLTATTNRAWVTSAATFTLNNLTAGQYIYFAVDRNGDFYWDATEISWTITATLGPPQPQPACTLSVNPTSVPQGSPSSLSWTSQNAGTMVIDQGIGSVTPVGGGSMNVSPNATTTYTATATGPGGTANCSTTLTVTAPPDTTPPTVAITSPSNGATVSGANVNISANAGDNVGVLGVQFKLDNINLGAEDTSAPYSIVWDSRTTSTGPHSLTAVARDAAGNTTTSAVVNVTVQAVTQSVWNSWNVVTQAGSPQARVTSATSGLTADVEFYESTNNLGVAKGSLFSIFQQGSHPQSFNLVETYWANTTGNAVPYAGKSTVNRGSGTSEGNTPQPTGVRDLQVYPPNNNHNVVVAFKVPQNGTYVVTNLAVRRVDNRGTTVRYRVFNAQATQLLLLTASNNRDWVTSATTLTLTNLTAGQYIYFAVDRNGDNSFDAAEISWRITLN